MSPSRFIEIDDKRYLWRDLLQLRRQQREQPAKAVQPALFELKQDARPTIERKAADRYLQPSLFTLLDSSDCQN
jgi:hypothetical protein